MTLLDELREMRDRWRREASELHEYREQKDMDWAFARGVIASRSGCANEIDELLDRAKRRS